MNSNDEPNDELAEVVSIPLPMGIARQLRVLPLAQRATLVADLVRQTMSASAAGAAARAAIYDVKIHK